MSRWLRSIRRTCRRCCGMKEVVISFIEIRICSSLSHLHIKHQAWGIIFTGVSSILVDCPRQRSWTISIYGSIAHEEFEYPVANNNKYIVYVLYLRRTNTRWRYTGLCWFRLSPDHEPGSLNTREVCQWTSSAVELGKYIFSNYANLGN